MSVYDSIIDILQEDSWTDSDEKTILEPFTFIASTPGKDIQSKLIAAFNQWLKVPVEQVKVIARIVNMVHTASLMIDDIEDDSDLRRGLPVAHKVYGVPNTINAANHVYFLVYQELIALRNNPAWGLQKLALPCILALHGWQRPCSAQISKCSAPFSNAAPRQRPSSGAALQ